MKKLAFAFIALIVTVILLFYINEKLFDQMWNDFIQNNSYELISEADSIYFNEYVEADHGMWFYRTELKFISDSNFVTSNQATFFQAPFFPFKYYLGILNFEPEFEREYYIRDGKVYSDWYSNNTWIIEMGEDSNYVGTIEFKQDTLIFKHLYYN